MYKPALTLLAMLSIMVSADTESQLDPENMLRLRSGEILHEHSRKDEAGGTIRVEIFVRAAVEDVWGMLEGCENAFTYVKGLKQCEVLEQTDKYALIHEVVKAGVFAPTQDYTYKVNSQPFSRRDFKLNKGSLKAMEGSWEFLAVEEGVIIVYQLHVQPAVSAPRFMVRRSIRKSIPDMLACIRGLVNGSGGTGQNKKDLQRCPGNA